jgi:hypothetical protein
LFTKSRKELIDMTKPLMENESNHNLDSINTTLQEE